MKVVVIGAGVVGSAIAFRLAEAGASVTVLDGGRVGGGTSGTSFAWTNSHHGNVPPEYHALLMASLALFPEVKRQFNDAAWFHPSGCIEWRQRHKTWGELEENVRQLQERGYRAEWISRERLLELEPGIDPEQVGDSPIAWFPDEGWLDPVAYADDMIRAAQGRGAALRTGARVVAIETQNGRATGVRLADGERLACDTVVNCAGRWAREVTDEPGLQIPLAPTVGFMVLTPPVASGVRRPIHSPEVHMRPDGAGRLMVRANDMDEAVTLETRMSPSIGPAEELMRRLGIVIPALRGVAAEAARVTARPIPEDGFPAVGQVPRLDGYYLAVTHSGVTLSPLLGKLVADEVMNGTQRPELARFRPTRFFN